MKVKDPLLIPMIDLAKHNEDIVVLWLYGSRATKTSHEGSDYDLAVAFKNFMHDPLERRLRPELLAMDWVESLQVSPRLLSIVDINLIPIPLAWEVVSKGRVIYAVDETRVLKEQERVMRIYEIDVLYHRRIYGQ